MPKYMQKTVIEIKSLCKDFEIKQKSSGFLEVCRPRCVRIINT